MRTISVMAIVSAMTFSAAVCAVTPGAAKAGPIVSAEHYCLEYDEGGMDCSFTSYAQCEATASGIGADCNGSTFRDDERFRDRGWRAGGYRGPVH
jgi:uncharacterized protein DUF3551